MLAAIQTLLCLSGTALGAILALYTGFHHPLSVSVLRRLFKAMVYASLLGIVALWWLEPQLELELAGVFWLATILALAAYFYSRPRLHPLPAGISGFLGLIMVYRMGNAILPVESNILVLIMNLLSGLVLTVFLVTVLSGTEEDRPTGGLWMLTSLVLLSRLLWDGYQLFGGKTESRFGLAEEIHTFFNAGDWWLISVGLLLAIGLPLVLALLIPYSRWGRRRSAILARGGFFLLLAGQGALVYFSLQYGIIF